MANISYTKTKIQTAPTGIFYMFETRVGFVGSTTVGVKIGTTVQEVYGRLRAYEQSGTQYITSAWKGPGTEIAFLEDKFKELLDAANMKHSFTTSSEEVFIGNKDQFMDNVEEIISHYNLPISFYVDGYHCYNKTQHNKFMAKNTTAPTVKRLNLSLDFGNATPSKLFNANIFADEFTLIMPQQV